MPKYKSRFKFMPESVCEVICGEPFLVQYLSFDDYQRGQPLTWIF